MYWCKQVRRLPPVPRSLHSATICFLSEATVPSCPICHRKRSGASCKSSIPVQNDRSVHQRRAPSETGNNQLVIGTIINSVTFALAQAACSTTRTWMTSTTMILPQQCKKWKMRDSTNNSTWTTMMAEPLEAIESMVHGENVQSLYRGCLTHRNCHASQCERREH